MLVPVLMVGELLDSLELTGNTIGLTDQE